MGLHISAAHDNFAFEADPIFFCVSTIIAWCSNSEFRKFFNRCNIFNWNAMRTFFNWLASIKAHDRSWLSIYLRLSFISSWVSCWNVFFDFIIFGLFNFIFFLFFNLIIFLVNIKGNHLALQFININFCVWFLTSFVTCQNFKIFCPTNFVADFVDDIIALSFK